MSNLALAVNAKIPLIVTNTRDLINVAEVIQKLIGIKPKDAAKAAAFEEDTLYYMVVGSDQKMATSPATLYSTMSKKGSSLILINTKPSDEMLNVGELPTPKDLKIQYLSKVVEDPKKLEEIVKALGGCTVKESVEFALITMARDKSLTAHGVVQTRKSMFAGSKGLTQVDTQQIFYQPSNGLAEWVAAKKAIFFDAPDARLRPRGLLFKGPPGTGKTEGAKYIAEQFGVPLFRLDIASTKNKYVGNSQENLANALSRVDAEEPCVLLIDEIEKVFAKSGGDNDGTTTDMLSQILWWLAEHRSRVLTVMTTNDEQKLPKELYREGRIDKAMYFGGLEIGEAKAFAGNLLKTYKGLTVDAGKVIDLTLSKAMDNPLPSDPITLSPAVISASMVDAIVDTMNNPGVPAKKAGAK